MVKLLSTVTIKNRSTALLSIVNTTGELDESSYYYKRKVFDGLMVNTND